MLNPIFWKKVQVQKHPGRWRIVEHQIPSIKVLFNSNNPKHKFETHVFMWEWIVMCIRRLNDSIEWNRCQCRNRCDDSVRINWHVPKGCVRNPCISSLYREQCKHNFQIILLRLPRLATAVASAATGCPILLTTYRRQMMNWCPIQDFMNIAWIMCFIDQYDVLSYPWPWPLFTQRYDSLPPSIGRSRCREIWCCNGLTDILAALLLRCLSNFRAIGKVSSRSSRFRNFSWEKIKMNSKVMSFDNTGMVRILQILLRRTKRTYSSQILPRWLMSCCSKGTSKWNATRC